MFTHAITQSLRLNSVICMEIAMKTLKESETARVATQKDAAIRSRAYGLWKIDGKQDARTLEYWLDVQSQSSKLFCHSQKKEISNRK